MPEKPFVRAGRESRPESGGGSLMLRRIWWVIALLVVLVGGYLGYRTLTPEGAFGSRIDRNPPAFRHRITVLLLGNALAIIDNKDQTNPYVRDRTDTMMLISINPRTDQANVLSIPRDTLVDIPGVGRTKINEANYFGGPKLAVKLVEETLHVPVDYYMETTMWNFEKIINSLGGLTVDVTQPMHYGGTGNPLDINLNPGIHHLDGQQVLEYVRFRAEPLGDISRIQQQQYIVKLILKKVLTPRYIDRLPSVINMLRQDIVYTNLSSTQMLALGLIASHLKLNQVRFATLPGHPIQMVDPYMHQLLSYWVLDPRLTRLMVREIVLDEPLTPAIRHQIYIIVKTGTTSLQPAEDVAAWLRHVGFDVTAVGWANHHNHRQNEILDFTGDKYLTERMAAALGPSGSTVVTESPYHLYPHIDFIITVGSDLRLNTHAVP
jgi:LCP family protein required for cell wall assembly